MADALRTGRTTGSCATAAAMAGVIRLLTGEVVSMVEVPLPPGGMLAVPVECVETVEDGVRATVIKDGGDDPDVTHGHAILAIVSVRNDDAHGFSVDIRGGKGVGSVTLPGLPVAVGEPAINPEPRKQIKAGVRQAAGASGRFIVTIEVPEGERLAKATMNPRLGIQGGISILGTQGIVKPYSHDSWKATIEEGLSVARAQGLDHVVFTTGRRSERLYAETHPDLSEQGFVQAADFFRFAMEAAGEHDFSHVVWALFFGKLVKQAQGMAYTHAKTDPIDFESLADLCETAGCKVGRTAVIESATARHVLGLLEDDPGLAELIRLLTERAAHHAIRFSGQRCRVAYAVFDFNGRRLDTPSKAKPDSWSS